MMLEQVATDLSQVATNFDKRDIHAIKEHLAQLKRDYVAQDNQDKAKEVWCLEEVLHVQEKYIEAFHLLQQGKFYPAWCAFERVEVEYSFLRRHLPPPHSRFYLDFILGKTHQWQSLFPYKLFSSLEFIKTGRRCMTCGQTVSLRRPCGHLIGEIYDGEMCCHEILKLDELSLSMVTNPHHKYAVLFPANTDSNSNEDGRYTILIEVVGRLETPFDEWRTFMGKRPIPRKAFDKQDPDSFCRCGSMEYFKDCCFDKSEILYPWVHVEVGDATGYSIPDFLILDRSSTD